VVLADVLGLAAC
jgi:hypothetical protein